MNDVFLFPMLVSQFNYAEELVGKNFMYKNFMVRTFSPSGGCLEN